MRGSREVAVKAAPIARLNPRAEQLSTLDRSGYDIDQRSDGTTFFTMRRVLGRTLSAIIEEVRGGDPAACARYTQRELLTAFATVCLTIDYAHSRGVIHRDIKPANIMLGDFGEVYVLDWGLALVSESEHAPVDEPPQRLSMTGELLGTPLYMAPEQMADPSVGPGGDVFSPAPSCSSCSRCSGCATPHAVPAAGRGATVGASAAPRHSPSRGDLVRATQTEPPIAIRRRAPSGGDRRLPRRRSNTQARRELAAAHARTAARHRTRRRTAPTTSASVAWRSTRC
jgi:serine/threonine-protein kinase